MISIQVIENYAKENDIPIMEKDGIVFLCNYIIENNIKSILEIGSAIGYSAIMMALCDKDITIDTVERDEDRYNIAVKNIKSFKLDSRINIYNEDAHDFTTDKKYDLIFIDAAKSSYISFFEKYKSNLNDNGVIITDNLSFHGMAYDIDNIKNRNTKQLVKKIVKYKEFLRDNEEFDTEIFYIGDEIAISKRKK